MTLQQWKTHDDVLADIQAARRDLRQGELPVAVAKVDVGYLREMTRVWLHLQAKDMPQGTE